MASVTKNKTRALHQLRPVKRVWIVILLTLIAILAATVYRNDYLYSRLGICNFKETKAVLSNQDNASYKGTKLLLSIITQPVLAARFFKYESNGLSWYKDTTQSIKTVGDEQITIRPLSLSKDKVVVCISETKKGSFKSLTDGTKIDKYLPPSSESKDIDWVSKNSENGSNKVDYSADNFSFKYSKNLFLYKDDGNIWLFTQKVSQKNIEMYTAGMNLPSTYLKIIVQPNPQNFSPKQFYLYHLYSYGPKYVNGDLDIDLDRYTKFGVKSKINLPENLRNYNSYFVANSIYTKFKDKMLIVEGLQLDTTFASLVSSLTVSD